MNGASNITGATYAVWAAVVGIIAVTVWAVVRRILRGRAELAQTQQIRSFVDSVAREVRAGARSHSAAEQALEVVEQEELREKLRIAVARIGLGDSPRAAAPEEPLARQFFGIWHVSARHGLGLGTMAELLVEDLDAQLSRRATAHSAMAGARLTVMVLLAMPMGAVLLGQTMGLDSFRLLIGHPLGNVLLLAGVMLAGAGVWWTEALSVTVLGGVGGRAGPTKEDPSEHVEDPLDAARMLDVFAAGLNAGLPLSHAWDAATAEGSAELTLVTALLELGAGEEAWRRLEKHTMFGPVARQAAQQTRAGTMLATGVGKHASRLRRMAADRAQASSEKILVVIAAPLTLCFLPAFVLVGLVPLVLGLADIN